MQAQSRARLSSYCGMTFPLWTGPVETPIPGCPADGAASPYLKAGGGVITSDVI